MSLLEKEGGFKFPGGEGKAGEEGGLGYGQGKGGAGKKRIFPAGKGFLNQTLREAWEELIYFYGRKRNSLKGEIFNFEGK